MEPIRIRVSRIIDFGTLTRLFADFVRSYVKRRINIHHGNTRARNDRQASWFSARHQPGSPNLHGRR